MPLGYNDFVGLSSREYKAYLKSNSDEDLKTQEVTRLRGEFAACYSVGAGVGFAVLTSCGPLVFSAIALRKRELCKWKYDMIREELEVRNIPLDTTDWKDLLIPVATGLIGTNIGLGVTFGLQNAMRTQPPVYYGVDDVSQSPVPVSALNQALGMVDNPGDASVGFEKGFVAEPGVVAHCLSNRTAMTYDFSDDYALTSQPAYDYGFFAETAGFAMGAQAAERTEKTLASLVASQTLTWLAVTLESRDSWERMRSTLDCKRQLQVGGLLCDYCDIKITKGCYKREW
ncbi:hypothetical protein PG985_011548 [Apiospora marii]|uniref:uncharacterized protein n=1 Tax=Apiospora marii TaxID=335849 RepID=UPI00312D3850